MLQAITRILFSVFLFSFGFIGFSRDVSADARCGAGAVCGAAFGGYKTIVSSCMVKGTGAGAYCANNGLDDEKCECTDPANCKCTLKNNVKCSGQPIQGYSCRCQIGSEDYGSCTTGTCTYGTPTWHGTPSCSGTADPITSGCCISSPTSTPTQPPTSTPGGSTPTPTPTGTLTPTPTPTPPVHFFSGYIYDDPDATTEGIGGLDNICIGSELTLVNNSESEVTANRPGETNTQSLTGASYSINVSTSANTYTVTLELPNPAPNPNDQWVCACNALPGDPYRCRYTSQTPPSASGKLNFFVKRLNESSIGWFQTLGGNFWAEGDIVSGIPAATCTPPLCNPALILTDALGTVDSPGFPLTDTGSIITSYDSGAGSYIHMDGARSNSNQAGGLGVKVPREGYDYFFSKFGDKAIALPNASKPSPGSNLGVYLHEGNLVISSTDPWQVPNNEQIIVFVNGSLNVQSQAVNPSPRVITIENGGSGFLMFIVKVNITFGPTVGHTDIYTDATLENSPNVEGVFLADNVLTVRSFEDIGQTTPDRKFIGAGTYVGWNGVVLQRNFDNETTPQGNATSPTETFVFRPDLLLNAPQELKSSQMSWREIAPRF